MALSFHVMFCYHDALLFRVPTWGLVQVGSKMLLLNIYVDDLTLSGDSTLHQTFWEEMRKRINIEPEVGIIVQFAEYKPRACTLT